jgi:hypothetical protein
LSKLKATDLFLRINKSIIISANHVRQVDGNTVFLSNGASFVIGKSYKGAFQEYLVKRTLNKL